MNKTLKSPIRILYVDDYPLDRALVRDALHTDESAFVVHEASTRQEFEALLEVEAFDLILSDFNILGFTGLQVLEIARERAPSTPVIIVTGTGSEEIAAEAIKRGAGDYVIKTPEHIRRLPFTIESVLETQRLRQEREQTRQKLRQSLEQHHQFFHSNPEYCYFISPEGKILNINRSALEALGYQRDEIIGEPLEKIYAPDYISRTKDLFSGWKQAGQLKNEEMEIVTKDGERRTVLLSASMVVIDGKLDHSIAIQKDITERKQAEEALRQSEIDLKAAQRYAKVGSWIWNIKTNQLEWSDEMYRIFGLDPDEFSGNLNDVIARAIHPEDRAAVERSNLSVLQESKPIPVEYRIIRPDGEIRTVWAEAGELIADQDGSPAMLKGYVQDITARKQAEQALRESEQKYRTLVETSPDGIITLNRTGKVLSVNQTFLDLTGFQESDFVGKNFLKAPTLQKQDLKFFGQIVKDAFRGNQIDGLEFKWKHANGEIRDGEAKVSFFKRDGKIIGLQSIVRDITEQVKSRQELTERNVFIETILENLPIGLAVNFIDRGEADYINPKFEEIYGWPAEKLRDIAAFFELVYPDPEYREKVQSMVMADIESGDLESMEWEGITATTSQGEKKIIFAKNIPIYEQNLMISTVQDITERVRAEEERQRLNEQLIEDANELEKRVQERTEAYQKIIDLTADREIRMAELKKVIKRLRAQLEDAGMEPVADDPLKSSD